MPANAHSLCNVLLCVGVGRPRPAEDTTMKRLLVGSVVLFALSTAASAVEIGPAFEALPPPPPEVAPYNWTGMYGRTNTLAPYDSLMFGAPTSGAPDNFVGS